MQQKIDNLVREGVLKQSLLSIVLRAIFIALVGFGAPAGVLAALAPRFFLGLTEGFVCPRGSEMVYEEWYDGESNQFRVGCLDDTGGETLGKTLLALLVYLGIWFLAFFYLALIIMLITRARLKKKYGEVE